MAMYPMLRRVLFRDSNQVRCADLALGRSDLIPKEQPRGRHLLKLENRMNFAELLSSADNGPAWEPMPDGPTARRLRVQRGVSPTALAAAVGVSERTLLRYEREPSFCALGAAARLRLGRVLRRFADGSEEGS